MASTWFTRLLPLALCFLVLFHGGFSQLDRRQQTQQPHRLRGPSDCRIDRITAREPNRRVEHEAGVSEFWESDQNDELECAGVEAVRHTIQPQGLLLPYYPSTPELVYVVRGRGIQGTVLPGCPETFETSHQSEAGAGGGSGDFFDRHQRVYRYKQGDILALPAGAVHWTYNDGDTPIVVIVLRDISNEANQLDRNFRKFFLAGNAQNRQEGQYGENMSPQSRRPGRSSDPQGRGSGDQPSRGRGQQDPEQGRGSWDQPSRGRGQQEPGQDRRPWEQPSRGRGQGQSRPWEQPSRGRGQQEPGRQTPGRQGRRPGRQGQQGQDESNIFNGFDDQILQEVFNVEFDTIRRLKGQDDNRGSIVRAENFQVAVPEDRERDREPWSAREEGSRANGIEQTICSTQLRANIANPANADVYNPRGGRLSTLNSHKLPILDLLQLSAERGVLYRNAVLAPHYNLNAHSVVYIISGSSRFQIVHNDGSTVFDDEVREGQLIVVPQDFAVVKKAGEEGVEWVAFKTNDNAQTVQLAGRLSVIRGLPDDVVANSYGVSREEAKNLKYSREESAVLSPISESSRRKGMHALLNVLFS